MIKKSMENHTQINSQIDLFLDPLWRCLATSILGRFWGRFGVHFGAILGLKIGLKAIGKIIKKMIGKKSCKNPQATRKTGLWSPKRNQSDWQRATGNWQLAGLGTGRSASALETLHFVPFGGHGGEYIHIYIYKCNYYS